MELMMSIKKPTNATDPEIVEGQVEHSFDFKPIEYHEWRQEGNMLKCISCPHPHGASINQGLVLSKDAEGKFVLTKEY